MGNLPYNEDEVIEVYPGAIREVSEEELRAQTAATKAKIAKAMTGKNNPAYKDGRRSYRNVANAKPGQGVDHIDGNSKDNRPSNLRKYKLKGPERSLHEKKHSRQLNFQEHSGRQPKPRGYVAKRNNPKVKV